MRKKDKTNRKAVIIKSKSFFSVSQIICGKVDVKLAKLAPRPRATRVTGRAQQSSVLKDPNKEKN